MSIEGRDIRGKGERGNSAKLLSEALTSNEVLSDTAQVDNPQYFLDIIKKISFQLKGLKFQSGIHIPVS